METKSVLLLAATSVTGALSVQCTPEKKQEKPLNIIYIMTDDHTQQMISCYGSKIANTPNIDRLADEGVIFTNSFVANSISGPSRACMLTGKHSHANGKVDNEAHFDGSQQTMPKILQANGYQTAIIGKWHLESEPTGFDHWEILPGQGDYYQPDFITREGTKREEGYVTDLITDKSIAWLDAHKEGKPFCLFVHQKAPHRNWIPKISDLAYGEDWEAPLPDTFFDDYAGREAASTAEMRIASDHDMDLLYDLKVYTGKESSRLAQLYNEGDTLGGYGRMKPEEKKAIDDFYAPIISDLRSRKMTREELARWKYQRYIKDYRKAAKAVDDNIGRLMTYLDENDLLDNTLIVYTSDQGFYMGEHGWFDKRFMYEESFRTPLVMRMPARWKKRGDIPQLVQNIDYAPTFLEIAGVKTPEDMHGVSLCPLIDGSFNGEWRNSLYYHYHEYPAEHTVKRHYGVRSDRYKLIHFYHDIDSWEFYDLETDPKELDNSYDKPEYAGVIADMKQELARLQNQYNDPIAQ